MGDCTFYYSVWCLKYSKVADFTFFLQFAPPSISIYATYPGATPETLNDSVVTLIERELSGVKNLLYYSATSDASGQASITATFKPGTDPELAQVDVQNKLKSIEPRLPQSVRQQGLIVEAASSGFLMMVGINSPNDQFKEIDLSDYLVRNVVEELKRVEGVGRIQSFGSEKAMRIWIDPNKLVSLSVCRLKMSQNAIQAQKYADISGKCREFACGPRTDDYTAING